MSERVISDPTAAGWELDPSTGYWMWAAEGGSGGSIQDGDTEGQITTWDGTEWTPDSSLTIDSSGDANFNGAGAEIKAAEHDTATSLTGAITFPRVSGGLPDFAALFGAEDGGLGVAAREGIKFYTGGGNTYQQTLGRMTIDADGNVAFQNGQISQASPTGQAYFIQSNSGGCAVYSGADGGNQGLFGTSTDHSIAFMTGNTKRLTMDTNGRVDITGSLYVNGTPKIGTSELIETLSTLRASTQDETVDVRQALASACDKLIEKFEAMQSTSTQEISDE